MKNETDKLKEKEKAILELLQKTKEQLDKVIKAAEEFICK